MKKLFQVLSLILFIQDTLTHQGTVNARNKRDDRPVGLPFLPTPILKPGTLPPDMKEAEPQPLFGEYGFLFSKKSLQCHSSDGGDYSCKNKCGRTSMYSCWCKPGCEEFGLCCLDYEMWCTKQNNSRDETGVKMTKEKVWEENILKRNLNDKYEYMTCETIPTKYGSWGLDFNRYVMVGKCPSNPSFNPDDKIGCESQVNKANIISIPAVAKDGLIFKNINCARCHGYNEANIRFATSNIICQNFTSNRDAFENGNISSILKFVAESRSCNFVYKISVNSTRGFRPSKLISCDGEIFNQACPINSTASNITKEACKRYRNPVQGRKKYKNAQCAFCHGEELGRISCFIQYARSGMATPTFGFTSFSVLLDFSSTHGSLQHNDKVLTEACKTDEVFIPAEGQCRKLICPEFKVAVNGSCVERIQASPADYPTSINKTTTHVYRLDISIELNASANENDLRKTFSNWLVEQLNVTFDHVQFLNMNMVQNDTEQIWNLQVILGYNDTADFNSFMILHQNIPKALIDLENITGQYVITQASLSNKMSDNLVCEYTEFTSYPKNRTLFLNTVNHNSTPESLQLLMQHPVRIFYTGFQWMTITVNACLNSTRFYLNCPMVSYNESEFEIVNTSARLVYSQQVYPLGEYEIRNGNLYVCSNFTRSRNASTFFPFDSNEAQGILTLVGSVLSLIGLILTFITYCLFPKLRNLPGICMMQLVVALFIAQLLLVAGVNQTSIPALCTAIAMIEHYTWLVTLFWMSVLAFDVFMTFTKSDAFRSDSYSKTLRYYTCFAWGTPFLIVAICALINFCDCIDLPFGYGDDTRCWIINSNAILYSFTLPVAIIVVTNIIFFTITVVKIRQTAKLATMATRKNDKHLLFVYVRLATIMGFTWLFGFLAAFTMVEELWYLFIIFNSLQGLFIFIAYVCNKRVLGMYRKLFTKKHKSRAPSEQPLKQSTDKSHSSSHDTSDLTNMKTTGSTSIPLSDITSASTNT